MPHCTHSLSAFCTHNRWLCRYWCVLLPRLAIQWLFSRLAHSYPPPPTTSCTLLPFSPLLTASVVIHRGPLWSWHSSSSEAGCCSHLTGRVHAIPSPSYTARDFFTMLSCPRALGLAACTWSHSREWFSRLCPACNCACSARLRLIARL